MRANSRMPVLPEFLSLNKVYYIIIIIRLQQSSDFWLDNWYWQWHLDSPSGVLGELEASSEPRLRDSVLLKNKSATFIICYSFIPHLTYPLVFPSSLSEASISMSLSRSNIFFLERGRLDTVLSLRSVENIPSPLPPHNTKVGGIHV